MGETPRISIIADPNGADKPTFVIENLLAEAHCRTFVNVDLIASGLNPFNPSAVESG